MTLTPDQVRKLRRAAPVAGNKLKTARALAGLTQVELCDALGITQSTLSDLERKRWGGVTVDTARRFSEFFGVEIEDLFPARRESVAS